MPAMMKVIPIELYEKFTEFLKQQSQTKPYENSVKPKNPVTSIIKPSIICSPRKHTIAIANWIYFEELIKNVKAKNN